MYYIYCIPYLKPYFSYTHTLTDPTKGKYYHMTSFVETRVERYVKNKEHAGNFVQYSRLQLSRVYPKGQRIDSSNYDPMAMWCSGSQLVSLNYQTPGEGEEGNREGGREARKILHCEKTWIFLKILFVSRDL